MKIHLQGGFSEKGRTSVLVQYIDTLLMLDAGIKVGAPDADYHPVLAAAASEIDALIVSHAHEDHIGALCWLVRQGFAGPIYMTEETHTEMPEVLKQYAVPEDFASVDFDDLKFEIFSPGDELKIRDLVVRTGHSGHVAGGIWAHVIEPTGRGLVYTGDLVPHSSVFPMSPLPRCDLLVLDASYGADMIGMKERVDSITNWISSRPHGALLPTPLSGRSIELISIMPDQFAIAEGMHGSLLSQINNIECISASVSARLKKRIETATVWKSNSQFPAMPLLAHDGMGVGGPSKAAIEQAVSIGHPILCTGHLPPGSPGEEAVKRGQSDWLRLPTHPNLMENVDIWNLAGNPNALGHSCASDVLTDLHKHIPALSTDAATGQTYPTKEVK